LFAKKRGAGESQAELGPESGGVGCSQFR
jgi:hypothetical protein